MPRPIAATINMAALASNLSVVRGCAPRSRVWSVVKANAYGHGLSGSWQALAQTDGFALLDLNEAIGLREQGWRGPLLLLEGFFQPADLKEIDRLRLTFAVHSPWQLAAIAAYTPSAPLSVYLKLNSGMNRLGFTEAALPAAWQQLRALPQVGDITLMTHFACSDMPEGVSEQMAVVNRVASQVDGPQCLANSAATLWHPDTHQQWIRPGIVLYGASPTGNWQDISDTGLQPVMELTSRVIGIQEPGRGQRIGYGGRYTVTDTQRVGVVACGYADGYPRHAPTGTPILVDGVRTRTLGAISMDMLAVDLSPCPQAAIGSPVELWGQQIKVDEVAAAAGTLGYELLCAVASRVPMTRLPFTPPGDRR